MSDLIESTVGLSVTGATANCGNGTLGKEACSEMIKLLSATSGGTDILIINFQEVSLKAALEELNNAIPEDCPIAAISSDLRVTKTKAFNFDVIASRTGIATIVLYRKDKISDIQFKPEDSISTSVANSNKGGLLNVLSVTSAEGRKHSVRTISAHLDSYSEANRIKEWHGIKAATFKDANNWLELASNIPDMQVAGFDANTRNLLVSTPLGLSEDNLWHTEKLDPRIAPIVLAPLGDMLYSNDETYKTAVNNIVEADPKRPGYAKSGSLDFVSIQNNTQPSIRPKSSEFTKHYAQANAIPSLGKGALRDHHVIISQPSILQVESEFNRVKFYLANELKYAAPLLSNEISLMTDSDENRFCLLEIYHYYLKGGVLLNKVKYAGDNFLTESGSESEPQEIWFSHDTLALFDWKEKQLQRGYVGESLSETSSLQVINAKREALKALIDKKEAERKHSSEAASQPEGSIILDILSKIPIVAGLIHHLRLGGGSTYELATLNNPAELETRTTVPEPIAHLSVLKDLYINTKLVSAIADFIELPLVYLASWMLGKPSPVTMTRLAEWLYSGVLLGLTILALAFPPAAPIVLGISIVLGLISSIYCYINFVVQENEVKQLLPETQEKINEAESKINELINKVEALRKDIDSASIENLNQLHEVLESLDREEKALIELRAKHKELTQKSTILSTAHLVDKTVGVALSVAAMVAFSLLLANNPIGWVILSAVSALALFYTVGRLLSPLVERALNKIVSIDAETSSPQIIVNGLENDLKIEPQVEPQHNPSPIGLDEASFVHLSESDTEYKAIPVMSPTGLSDAEEEEIPSHAIERDSTIDR